MSTWHRQSRVHQWGPSAALADRAVFTRLNARTALWFGCLICVLAAEGIAVTRSDLWAAPVVCILIVAVATDLPLVPFVGTILLIRVLTD
jgi:hypothetical protein